MPPTHKYRIVITAKKIRLGEGVKYFKLIMETIFGKWPSRAPTKNNLAEENIPPLRPPKVDKATHKGISQAITPKILSPNAPATALDANISPLVKTEKYAILVRR
ncbi:hypothetical protein X975_23847, partial [Stegodyphus mimosarum]